MLKIYLPAVPGSAALRNADFLMRGSADSNIIDVVRIASFSPEPSRDMGWQRIVVSLSVHGKRGSTFGGQINTGRQWVGRPVHG